MCGPTKGIPFTIVYSKPASNGHEEHHRAVLVEAAAETGLGNLPGSSVFVYLQVMQISTDVDVFLH